MSDLMFFLITIPGAFIVLSIIGYFYNPKVKWATLRNKGGENTLFEIIVDPAVRFKRAVLAQEIAERKWKWARGFGIPILQSILQRIPAMNRSMELWGHEVEVQAAVLIYDADEALHRVSEAQTMAVYSGYEFESAKWSPEKIERKMIARRKKARKWVTRHLTLIARD